MFATISCVEGIFLMIRRPMTARKICGMNIQMAPILAASIQKTKKAKKKTNNSATVLHQIVEDRSKIII